MEEHCAPRSETEQQEQPVAVRQDVHTVSHETSLTEALAALERTSVQAIPIVNEAGEIQGWLSRQPPQPVALPTTPPPRLGGMATPLGVYLTDGVWSGGAGFWGLVLTGMVICSLGLVAQGILHFGLLLYTQATHHTVWAWINTHPPAIRDWLSETVNYVPLLLVFILLRLIPLSGTHAAEHQVVHCVERGLPLVQDQVRTMPRAHPRCGTNLIVGVTLFMTFYLSVFCLAQAHFLSVTDSATLGLLVAVPITVTQWRRLGAVMQQWFATKPATDGQIASGIRAAEQVLAFRQTKSVNLSIPRRLLRRVWAMGFAQLFLGYAVVVGVLTLLTHLWPWIGNILEN